VIASARGLVALSVIAAVLAVIVALDRGGSPGAPDRRLVTALDPARTDTIELGGAAPVTLAKDHDAWRVVAPAPGPADGAAVADLLGALAAARWEREVDDAPAWTDTRTITLGGGGARTTVHLGPELAGAQQIWARVDGGPARLVPSWLATAAARDADAVREARLVRVRPDQITGLELHGRGVDLVVEGNVARLPAGSARIAPAAKAALDAALVALHASSFPTDKTQLPPRRPDALTIRVLGGTTPDEVDAAWACPGRAGETLVAGTAGPVCVPDAQLDAVVAAARAIATGAGIDPSPLRAAPITKLVLASGAILAAKGGGFTVQASPMAPAIPADDDAVHELLAALTAPGTIEPTPPGAPVPAAPAPIRADYADGTTDALRVVTTPAGPALSRDDGFVLRVAPAALAAARATADELRDRGLISEEPTALTALDVTAGTRHGHAARGATTSDWTGDLDGVAVLAAADVIAHLRAARFVPDAEVGAVRLAITATFAAPPIAGAKPVVHAIEIGAERTEGCAGRVDGHAVVLDLARCAALAALAPQ
jgi:hypothetical protein